MEGEEERPVLPFEPPAPASASRGLLARAESGDPADREETASSSSSSSHSVKRNQSERMGAVGGEESQWKQCTGVTQIIRDADRQSLQCWGLLNTQPPGAPPSAFALLNPETKRYACIGSTFFKNRGSYLQCHGISIELFHEQAHEAAASERFRHPSAQSGGTSGSHGVNQTPSVEAGGSLGVGELEREGKGKGKRGANSSSEGGVGKESSLPEPFGRALEGWRRLSGGSTEGSSSSSSSSSEGTEGRTRTGAVSWRREGPESPSLSEGAEDEEQGGGTQAWDALKHLAGYTQERWKKEGPRALATEFAHAVGGKLYRMYTLPRDVFTEIGSVRQFGHLAFERAKQIGERSVAIVWRAQDIVVSLAKLDVGSAQQPGGTVERSADVPPSPPSGDSSSSSSSSRSAGGGEGGGGRKGWGGWSG
uniref:Uncharacterized protein n=1 Tax=Chromera velia CCMP2878 TaxID=1169474 RepID=A0A0G4IC74_9ALVE|eukprot:Cvel_2250.t1-p1 / transcript=Cvel_2250.t1 / gene=Cvel_2250 / organism=Chromera_velia_CCMP2878 / gene_product=hypothetical protein / transcript_product=hypothetical protein / location=Cvel_scaffold87:2638-6054(-) / protein_length=421 / sequence_SO=supercontig / SO=protein_coding / is_pseudo=false